MPWSIAQLYLLLPLFLLVLFRVSGLMLAAPLFSSAMIPTQLRVLLAVAISLAVFPYAVGSITAPVTLGSAVAGLIGELAIGLLIGFCVSLLFLGIQLAGNVVSQQAGLALGDVFNPMLDTSSTVVSELYFWVAMVVFLLAGGDRELMRSLLDSFHSVPPLSFRMSSEVTEVLVDLMGVSFAIAVRMAGPTMLALLLAFVTLGFISRTMPQLNILTVGFPVKLALAIFVMAVSLIAIEPILLDGWNVCLDGIRGAVGLPPL